MRITGYTYQADTYCVDCLAEKMVHDGDLSTPAHRLNVEVALDDLASLEGIDRYNEHTFDSDDFPKVIFSTDDNEQCGNCGEAL